MENNNVPLQKMIEELMKGGLLKDPAIQAELNDRRLQRIAEYSLSRGYTVTKPIDDEQYRTKFSELKLLVIRKETTLAELESKVFSEFGVQEMPREMAPQNERTAPIGFNIE